MKTTLVPDENIGKLDVQILNTLNPEIVKSSAIRKERMLIGILNEDNALYRIIGISDRIRYVETLDQLATLDLVHDLNAETYPMNGFNAIFRRR